MEIIKQDLFERKTYEKSNKIHPKQHYNQI